MRLARAGADELHLARDERRAHLRDLLGLHERRPRDLLAALRDPREASRLDADGPAVVAHARGVRGVRALDGPHAVHALEQVGEAVGVEHDRHDVRPVGLVVGDQLAREHPAVDGELQLETL